MSAPVLPLGLAAAPPEGEAEPIRLAPQLVLLTAPPEALPGRAARLRALCRLAERLPAFLPLSGPAAPRAALTAALAPRLPALGAALDRLAGACELVVTAEAPVPEARGPAAAEDGRGWLRQRLADERQRRARAAALRDALDRLAETLGPELRGRRIHSFAAPGAAGADLALLVDRAAAPDLRARLGRDCTPSGWRVTGPWPCLGFAAAVLDTAEAA
jgi:hypothetical protein